MADHREPLRAILELVSTSNHPMASGSEREDSVHAFARVLMGLSHPLQIVGQTRELACTYDWQTAPRLERHWYAVVTADNAPTLERRVRLISGTLEGIGLRCRVADEAVVPQALSVTPTDAMDSTGHYVATMVLRRWPREVGPGWLGIALAEDIPVDVAIHVLPQDAARIARFLKRQQSWQDDGGKDAANALGRRDAEATRKKLIAHQDRPVKVAIALTVRAATRDLVKQHIEALTYAMGLSLADVRLAKFEQDRGLEATQLTGVNNLLGSWRTLDCTSVASTWPFQPATINHTNGADIGTTHEGSMLVRLDPFDMSLESFGGIVLAKVGAGKSYFLKLFGRRLEGVEVLIVEQRNPAEYTNVPGVHLNLADVPYAERATHLRTFVSELWETAKRDPRPRLLVLDELWSLLRDPDLASLIEEIARIGRHHYLALWIASQQVQELLDSGKAVLDNAAVRVYLKQHDRDLESLCNAVGLPTPARRFLRGAARGQALLDVGGMLVPVDIQATPEEHRLITTDPREIAAHDVGSTDSEIGTDRSRASSVWLASSSRDRRNGHPVGSLEC